MGCASWSVFLVRSGYRAAAASQSERWVASRLVIHLALCVDRCAVVAVAAGHGGQRVPTVELLPVPAAACPADLAEIWSRHPRRAPCPASGMVVAGEIGLLRDLCGTGLDPENASSEGTLLESTQASRHSFQQASA